MSRTDPTGRQGAPSSLDLSSADPAHDLATIYQGGAKFLDRMRALDDARCALGLHAARSDLDYAREARCLSILLSLNIMRLFLRFGTLSTLRQ
jgi:hypothetical protein